MVPPGGMVSGVAEPMPFVEMPNAQHLAKFSPDGRYVAYLSQESGRSEVYVERFPEDFAVG